MTIACVITSFRHTRADKSQECHCGFIQQRITSYVKIKLRPGLRRRRKHHAVMTIEQVLWDNVISIGLLFAVMLALRYWSTLVEQQLNSYRSLDETTRDQTDQVAMWFRMSYANVASEMTYIVSGRALNFTHSLRTCCKLTHSDKRTRRLFDSGDIILNGTVIDCTRMRNVTQRQCFSTVF